MKLVFGFNIISQRRRKKREISGQQWESPGCRCFLLHFCDVSSLKEHIKWNGLEFMNENKSNYTRNSIHCVMNGSGQTLIFVAKQTNRIFFKNPKNDLWNSRRKRILTRLMLKACLKGCFLKIDVRESAAKALAAFVLNVLPLLPIPLK